MIIQDQKLFPYLIVVGIENNYFMKIKCIFCLFVISLSGCYTHGQDQGAVIYHAYFYGSEGSTTIPHFELSRKIWFKNNSSIQEVPLLLFTEDSSGQKTSFKIKHYSYLDPDKNVCYNYLNISDTAKVIKYYSDIDSVVANGGWNFYSNQKFEYDSLTNLSDSVVDNIHYGRIRLDKVVNGNNVYFILYFRCDKKGTLVKVFKPLSDSIGCPIVRDDTFIKNRLFMTEALEFAFDKLSPEELKIFEAWERNAKQNH